MRVLSFAPRIPQREVHSNLSILSLSLDFRKGDYLSNLPGLSPPFNRGRESSPKGFIQGHTSGKKKS